MRLSALRDSQRNAPLIEMRLSAKCDYQRSETGRGQGRDGGWPSKRGRGLGREGGWPSKKGLGRERVY